MSNPSSALSCTESKPSVEPDKPSVSEEYCDAILAKSSDALPVEYVVNTEGVCLKAHKRHMGEDNEASECSRMCKVLKQIDSIAEKKSKKVRLSLKLHQKSSS